MSTSPYLRELYIDIQWTAKGSERSTATWVESADGKRVCTMRPCDDDWSHAQSIAKAHNVAPKLAEALRKAREALYNVPEVGDVYDQQHSDTHMHAVLLIDAALAEWDAQS